MKVFRRYWLSSVAAWAVACHGCGAALPSSFPNALTDADGQTILLEAVRDIIDDDTLTETQQREAIRAHGIDDEQLIDALLEL